MVLRIAYITAGAAGMYCGSCLHDNTLAAALMRAGHDVALIPTYTPIRTDEHDVSIGRVFYGAINVYLEQKSPLFRHTPRVLDRLFDGKGLLDWAARRGASTDARQLGDLTLSIVQGEEGRQSKELDKLIRWMREHHRPDIVHLTNSMFLGMARRMRRELDVPVLCSVQGEDIFLDELFEPYRSRVRRLLVERARDVDAFTATSRYYVDFMSGYLEVPREQVHHVRLGLNLEGHGSQPPGIGELPFTIGYLARVCPEKGLHNLVEAFRLLADDVGRERVRLRVAGWLGERDRPYLEGLRDEVGRLGLDGVVDFLGEVDRSQKIDFLRSIHVLSVPTTYHEPKGLYVLEALANGVPVVQPRHGAFPELIDDTGGGLLVEPESPEALARALRELMDDPARRKSLGLRGQEVVRRDYTDEAMAGETLKLYRRYVQNSESNP